MKNSVIAFFRKIREKIRYYRRIIYMPVIERGLGEDFSIVSSNCFGGRIYQDLKKSYMSPTAGLFFFFDDYVKFVENFEDYINRDIDFISHSKWELANEKMKTREFIYPIGQIHGTNIEIHFLHYHSQTSAKDKWNRRRDRINKENIVYIGFYQNLPNEASAERFLKMPNTILFSPIKIGNYSNCIYIPEFSKLKEAPNPYIYARIYYKYLAHYFNTHII